MAKRSRFSFRAPIPVTSSRRSNVSREGRMKSRAIALVAVVTTIVAIAAGTCKDQVAPELARATAGGDVALETAAACDSTHYKAVRPYLDSLNKYTTKGN